MPDPLTTNKFLAQPTRGSDVGTWDTPMNNNAGIIDASFGGNTTVALAAANVTLNAAQYQNVFITLTGALAANVSVTFPAVGSFYKIINQTTNSSQYQITLQTTAAGGQVVGVPWGDVTQIFTDGVNVKFHDLPKIGTYWDYAGSSVPAWVTTCTVPPWLNCDGTAFSSATYPTLNLILGSSLVPDVRGRYRVPLNQGTGRITSSQGGVDGNTRLAAGGVQQVTLAQANMPSYNLTVNDPGHVHVYQSNSFNRANVAAGGNFSALIGFNSGNTNSATTGITVNSAGGAQGFANLPPTIVSGITMVRAG